MKRVLACALVAAFGLAAATSAARPIHTVATASDSGQYFATASFSTNVPRPDRLELHAVSTPAVPMTVDWSYSCSRGFRHYESRDHSFDAFGRFDHKVALLIRDPRKCSIFADATYENFDSEQLVAVNLSLAAKQRRKGH